MMNIQGLMKQAQMMQKKMQEEQQRLEQEEFEGVSGGMVKVVINGKFNMQKINIDKNIISPDESEIIEDLIVAAFNDAKAKAENKMSESMSSITGGLNLGGMKLPF